MRCPAKQIHVFIYELGTTYRKFPQVFFVVQTIQENTAPQRLFPSFLANENGQKINVQN